MTSWTESAGNMVILDLETTGTDVRVDRIVTAAVVTIRPGAAPSVQTWLVNPGVDIPAEASAVHGVTTEQARTEGVQPAVALAAISQGIANVADFNANAPALSEDFTVRPAPLVAFNAAFDLSMLSAECARHGVPVPPSVPVVDPFVVDKAVDRYRPGKRTLEAACATYGVALGGAHNAAADALAAGRLVWRMAQLSVAPPDALAARYADRRYPEEVPDAWQRVGRMTIAELHTAQAGWHGEQQKSFADYLRGEARKLRERIGLRNTPDRAQTLADADDLDRRANEICGGWPIRQQQSIEEGAR